MAEKHTTYDAIPYPSNPFRQTRPERLAAVAKLFGLEAPPADNCRVLEIRGHRIVRVQAISQILERRRGE